MSQDELSDQRLMARIVEHDNQALEMLFARHAPIVLGLAVRMLRDLAPAEDVLQETFIRVWTKASTYDEQKGKVSSWVYGIARNKCIDFMRKHKTGLEEIPVVGNPHPVIDTDEAAFESLRRSQIRTAMEKLPEKQREVIELSYFEGLTRREISQAIGEPLGTVNTRARLGLKKLRTALQEGGFEIQ